ncbi:hypothetical protein [Scytonema sp. NUACC26]|uniref:hypothetical protein n=1 Tax=Scytonema sp. NUACC26 TaxID=3140176 RepID=UPI0034DBDCA4
MTFSVFSRRQVLQVVSGFVAASAKGSIPLVANLIADSTLNSPAQAQISGRVCLPLESGSIISLECLGDKLGPRYLDGRTKDGTVGLAPSFGGMYTGTKWRVDRRQSTSVGIYYTFYCLGDIPGSNYLDGRTIDGTVGLAHSYGEGRYTGARWRVYTDGNSYSLYCLGSVNGPKWLDGRTGDGTVGLAPSVEERYTGTKWKLTYQG